MSTEISRRRALQIATLGAASAVVGGLGTWRSLVAPASAALELRANQPLREPLVLASRQGVLEVRLTAAAGVGLAGRRTRALGYNGTSPGPTLRVAPGDVLRVTLANHLDHTTNLHTHGLHVSPEGNSDNVFRVVEPGQSARYEYAVPADHPTGTFWYHPHRHGTVADQMFGGLFGALVVGTPDDQEPARERVLVVSDITLTANGEVAAVSRQQVMVGREGDLVLVNGQLRPRIDVTAGSPERWRVVNACTSRFLELALDVHTWGFLGYDGQQLGEPDERNTVVLAPGNRADLRVQPLDAGDFTLRTLGHDRGGMGMMGGGASVTSSETTLAVLRATASSSPAASGATSVPSAVDGRSREVADLRGEAVDARRTITFTMGMGMGMGMEGGEGMSFGFDGREFDPGRVDQRVAVDTVEEWTIANTSPMDHPFHIHVWPMQLIAADDVDPTGRPDWRDVVIVPARGQVTVRLRFADFGGRTVYHCHILDHEDSGMMGVIDAR